MDLAERLDAMGEKADKLKELTGADAVEHISGSAATTVDVEIEEDESVVILRYE